jgi:hypothetical protein
MRYGVPVLAAVGLLGGCGQAETPAQTFDAEFRTSCVNSAYSKGVEEPVAREICDCALGKINQTFTPAQKQSTTNEQLMPIMNECVGSVVKKNG